MSTLSPVKKQKNSRKEFAQIVCANRFLGVCGFSVGLPSFDYGLIGSLAGPSVPFTGALFSCPTVSRVSLRI